MQSREASTASEAHNGEATKPEKKPRATKYISMRQATEMMDAVAFAREIGIPLVAHLTIQWGLTMTGDDPNGKLFAKVRKGLDKALGRRGIRFAGVWAREAPGGDVEHCHLLFHLPSAYRRGPKLHEIEITIRRLVDRHGDIWGDRAVDLVIWPNPDGKYLVKGGGKKVWERFRVRKKDRHLQGHIQGKRCGVTENIGLGARQRWEESHEKRVRERQSLSMAA